MKKLLIVPLALAAAFGGGATSAVQTVCGVFTDVPPSICPLVLEAYYSGTATGTSATTFSPNDPLTRGQGAVFVAKELSQSLSRASRRAALGQWWTTKPRYNKGFGVTTLGPVLNAVASDGVDLWVTSSSDGSVFRVRASDGRLKETWTMPTPAFAVLVAMGKVFVSSETSSELYMIDPAQPPGAVTTVSGEVGPLTFGLAFDGSRIWSSNGDSVSIITPGPNLPWSVTTVHSGFQQPQGILFDGTNVWVTDNRANSLLKLDVSGAILQTVSVGSAPGAPVFDGSSIWVPSFNDGHVTVVRASTGEILAILTGNGLEGSTAAAFDGERVLVTNFVGLSVSLWRAADLKALGSFKTGPESYPSAVCSDGLNFWMTLNTPQLARF